MTLIPKPVDCGSCPLYGDGLGFSRPEGSGSKGVLIIGEALGAHERADGLPFRPHAEAGSVLERAILRAGFCRDHFRLWNTIACQPPDNRLEGESWEDDAITHCQTHVRRVAEAFRPRAILALGGVATRTLTGLSGPELTISRLRGYVLESEYAPVVPSFHPSYLRRGGRRRDAEGGKAFESAAGGGGMSLMGVLIHDLQLAVAVAGGAYKEYVLHPEYSEYFADYQEQPSLDDARSFLHRARESPQALLSYDLEHPRATEEPDDEDLLTGGSTDLADLLDANAGQSADGATIHSAQFSLAPRSGIYLPWIGEYREIAAALLDLPNRKAGHFVRKNDNPRLRTWGIIPREPVIDTWEQFHHLQPDIPANLQFAASFARFPFPWKHWRRSQQARYGIADVDALQWLVPWLERALDRAGLQAGYQQVLKLGPVFAGMTERGVPVDAAAHSCMAEDFQTTLTESRVELQAGIPDAARVVHNPEGYTRPPAHVRLALLADPACRRVEGADGSTYLRDPVRELATTAKEAQTALAFGDPSGAGADIDRAKWRRLDPFNPQSAPQVLAYIQAKGHPLPQARNSGGWTTSETALGRLYRQTHDPTYRRILEHRELRTLLSTFIPGWAPHADGRVHPQFYTAPGTGQHSSRGPNVQNAPKHTRLADSFRRIVRASPGHWLVSFDWKSFHALMLGFEAQDAAYMRLARLDIHAFLAAHLLGLPEADGLLARTDDELADYFRWLRSCGGECRHSSADKRAGKCWGYVRDNQAKRAILGWAFGQTAWGLAQHYPEVFAGVAAARRVTGTLEGLFSHAASWHDQIREIAHRQTFLRSRWDFIRHFWDVQHRDPRTGRAAWGDDSEAAIAFLPANDAFGLRNDAMIQLEAGGANARFGLINEIHDELLYECPDALVDECVATVQAEMERPRRELTDPAIAPAGLGCAVGVKIGRHWAAMHAWTGSRTEAEATGTGAKL